MTVTRGPRDWWLGYCRAYRLVGAMPRRALAAYDAEQLRRSLRPSHMPARHGVKSPTR